MVALSEFLIEEVCAGRARITSRDGMTGWISLRSAAGRLVVQKLEARENRAADQEAVAQEDVAQTQAMAAAEEFAEVSEAADLMRLAPGLKNARKAVSQSEISVECHTDDSQSTLRSVANAANAHASLGMAVSCAAIARAFSARIVLAQG